MILKLGAAGPLGGRDYILLKSRETFILSLLFSLGFICIYMCIKFNTTANTASSQFSIRKFSSRKKNEKVKIVFKVC
jgi:hypothetical protein